MLKVITKGTITVATIMTTIINRLGLHTCRLFAANKSVGFKGTASLPILLVVASAIVQAGCANPSHPSHDAQYLVTLETLKIELKNPDYEWNGPTSVEDRIPMLHAAQALAYRGDSAADVLFDAIDDPEIEIISIFDAVSNLGIPAYRFRDEILSRDSSTVRKWWEKNRDSTLDERNRHRLNIGLPPALIK